MDSRDDFLYEQQIAQAIEDMKHDAAGQPCEFFEARQELGLEDWCKVCYHHRKWHTA